MVSTDTTSTPAAGVAADADLQHPVGSHQHHAAQQKMDAHSTQPCSSAACSGAPESHQSLLHTPMDDAATATAGRSCSSSDDSEAEDMVEDDGCMSDADSGDSDLTARITGLEVRLARRSAEVEMLKAAVAACQADARRTPSPPGTPQAPLRPVARRAEPDPMPRLLSADSAGQFVVSLDGRVVLGSGPYAGKPLSQVAQHDPEYLQAYLHAPPPPDPQSPTSQSQLLAALALRNTLPVRCR